MFADDICLFCPSVRWLQRILDVCQAYAESHGIIFNCNKTVCMTFKAKSAKSTVTPLLTLGGQNVKSVNQYNYLGIVLDTELSDDKDIQRQLRYQYCAANKLRASFSRCWNAVKNVLFRSFCTPMYASQLWCNFRKSCMQRLRVAHNFGCRALYNLPWRTSVSSHQVQCNIPTFEALLPGAEPYIFIWGGHWRGQFCNKGAFNGLCRTFRKRPTPVAWRHAENLGGATGGPRQNFGGAVASPGTPLAPPLFAM